MATQAQMEALSTAFDANTRARSAATRAPSLEAFRAETRAVNALEDACAGAGMDRSYGRMEDWAAIRLARWFASA